MRAHRCIDKHHLAIGELAGGRVDAGQIRAGHAGFAGEPAINVDVAVLALAVADLSIVAAGGGRLQLRVLEIHGTVAPGEVNVALDEGVAYEVLPLKPNRVLESDEVHANELRQFPG